MPSSSLVESCRFGCLVVDDPAASALPLEHTLVVGRILGPLASVTVQQHFQNTSKKPVNLVYMFPLPENAAIYDYELRIGSRCITAVMEAKEQAKEKFDAAAGDGYRASLLEKRRENLICIQLSNVQPGERIETILRYQQRVSFEANQFEFVFPMGITPKFHADPREADQVDAPVAMKGEPIGKVEIRLSVDVGQKALEPTSPSHLLQIVRIDERRFDISLDGEHIPNKDFVLRYRLQQEELHTPIWVSSHESGAVVLLSLVPPTLTWQEEAPAREFVFVMDHSGSMSGPPLEQARNALKACLRSLSSCDTYYILAFNEEMQWYRSTASAVTDENIQATDAWLSALQAMGGTDIPGALLDALSKATEPDRPRVILFFTDGAVSSEDHAIGHVRQNIGSQRLHVFGIGPSVNRSLLKSLARAGRGMVEFLQADEDIEEAIIRFQDRLAYPCLENIRLDWKNGKAWDIHPSPLPDLYYNQPVQVMAHYVPEQSKAIAVMKGHMAGRPLELEVEIPQAVSEEPIIMRAWAQARIETLLEKLLQHPQQAAAVRDEIIGLALQQRLLTRFTSFVAVDEEKTEVGRDQIRIAVPLPEGLQEQGFFGGPMQVMKLGLARPAAAHRWHDAAKPKTRVSLRMDFRSLTDSLLHHSKTTREMDTSPASDTPPATTEKNYLHVLARTQNVMGSWGRGDEEIEMTCAGILAFVRSGNTLQKGAFRRQLAKAVKWLLSLTRSDSEQRHLQATALAEIAAASNDRDLLEKANQELAKWPAWKEICANPTTKEEWRAAVLSRMSVAWSAEKWREIKDPLTQLWAFVAGEQSSVEKRRTV
jgi:Ca-activated chloride channel homolog